LKVAIPSQKGNLESKLDQRFARANCFIIVDTITDEYQIINNEQRPNTCQKTCNQTVLKVSGQGVAVVITRNCGPIAFWELGAVGIRVFYSTEGTVKEVLEKFKSGKLNEAVKANVGCQWGLSCINQTERNIIEPS